MIKLLPFLCSADSYLFAADYLEASLHHLLAILAPPKTASVHASAAGDRAAAFHAIGDIAAILKGFGKTDGKTDKLDAVVAVIKEGLKKKPATAKGPREDRLEESILYCLQQLAGAVTNALTKDMHELLDLMFAYGLSDSLQETLIRLGKSIEPLQPEIQERMLDLVAEILSGEPFVPQGAPHPRGKAAVVRSGAGAAVHEADQHSDRTVELALSTLQKFKFDKIYQRSSPLAPEEQPPLHSLAEFVRDHAVRYVEAENPAVRRAAALACCDVLQADPVLKQTSAHAIKLVNEVLEKLLTLAIADPEAEIRKECMNHLTEDFDRHLAQQECVRSLFIALNDEAYDVREMAIKVSVAWVTAQRGNC